MIVPEDGKYTAQQYGNYIRQAAMNATVDNIWRSGRLPSDWKYNVKSESVPRNFQFDGVKNWAKTKEGRGALMEYAKAKGPLRFKGLHSMEQLELTIWDNMLEPLANLVIGDSKIDNSHLRETMKDHIRQFKIDRGKLWSATLKGQDPLHDKSRANQEVMNWLDEKFDCWQEKGDYGRLFMLKLMAPEAEPLTFTYLKLGSEGKIVPAFKNETLSYIKLGLRWWNQTNRIPDIDKGTFFDYVSNWHNSSFQAFYGKRADRTNAFNSHLSDLTNERLDIIKASPLLDDITPYDYAGGIQQQVINPHVQRATGIEPNQSIVSIMGNEPLFPSFVKKLSESTLMSYMPKAYINAGVKGKAHPAIHGYKSYNRAVEGSASALLGDALYRDLVPERSINHFKGAYKDIIESDRTGKSEARDIINTKENNNPLDCG